MIIDETYKLLKERYAEKLATLVINEVRIGPFLTAVSLSDNTCGTSSTLSDTDSHCPEHRRNYGEFSPLNIRGRKVSDLFETDKASNLLMSLRVAVLNALSSDMITPDRYRVMENCDPVDMCDAGNGKTITMVGAFQSYIRKIGMTGSRLYVLEMNEDALADDQKRYYVPAGDYNDVFALSDVVIITGYTLVNNTIDDLLGAVPAGAQVIVSGPSGSIIPDVLFSRGVDIIGATRITRPDLLLELAGDGGAGYHLFRYCAQKICIMPRIE